MALTYSIYEAKAKLSEIIRKVRSNNLVVITDRGVPVVKLIPVEPSASALSVHLMHLRESGLIENRKNSLSKLAKPPTLGRKPGALARFLKDR